MKKIFFMCCILYGLNAHGAETVPDYDCTNKQTWTYVTYYEGDSCPTGYQPMYMLNNFCSVYPYTPCGQGVEGSDDKIYQGADEDGTYEISGFCPYQ